MRRLLAFVLVLSACNEAGIVAGDEIPVPTPTPDSMIGCDATLELARFSPAGADLGRIVLDRDEFIQTNGTAAALDGGVFTAAQYSRAFPEGAVCPGSAFDEAVIARYGADGARIW